MNEDIWTKYKQLKWILSGVDFPPGLGVDEKRDYLVALQKKAFVVNESTLERFKQWISRAVFPGTRVRKQQSIKEEDDYPMDILDVKVVKSGGENYWYRKLIGEVFEVYDNGHDYIVKEDYDRGSRVPWRHIDKDDVKIVTRLVRRW